MSTEAEKTESDPLIATATVVESGDVETPLQTHQEVPYWRRVKEVWVAMWSLGIVAFGDSSSQVAIIQDQLCEQRRWLDKETFMELFALAQALPGPLATQLVMASAMCHAGPFGGFFALLIWVIPGAVVLTIAGFAVDVWLKQHENTDDSFHPLFLMGVPPATVALVFKAAYRFSARLDNFGFALAMTSCGVSVLINGDYNIAPKDAQFAYPTMLVAGGILTLLDATLMRNPIGTYSPTSAMEDTIVSKRIGLPPWAALFILQNWLLVLLALILLATQTSFKDNALVQISETFYRIGSLVFGGEDVLAMLDAEMVPDWVTRAQFLQGLGIAQALPGPLFNFAAYIGAIKAGTSDTLGGGGRIGVAGAALAVVAIFLPSYLFLLAGLALWSTLHKWYWFKALLKGVNAVAIGFVGAACIFLWQQAVLKTADAMVFILAGGLSCYYNLPPPLIFLLSILFGALLNAERVSLGQKPYSEQD